MNDLREAIGTADFAACRFDSAIRTGIRPKLP